MQKLIFIKLGGSVITDKSKAYTAKKNEIRRLGREIKSFQKKYKDKIILAHGSGSFGHFAANKYQTHKGLINKNSIKGMVETSGAAQEINQIVMRNLIKVGLDVKAFAPSSFMIGVDQKPKKILIDSIKQCLLTGVTPVIYGDVVMDEKQGFCIFSAEKVIEALVKKLHKKYNIDKIIYLTDTNGVYDALGKTIPLITLKNFKNIKKQITGSKSVDVTGGMIHKVEESLKLAKKYKVKIEIINGFAGETIDLIDTKRSRSHTLIR